MSRRLYTFHGGLHLPEHKAESTTHPITAAAIPPLLVLPVQQHIGQPAKPLVRVGDKVLKGQMVAQPEGYVSVPIHASSSGTVVAIEERQVPHPSGLPSLCIVIETDGEDRWIPLEPMRNWRESDPADVRNRVRDAGIVGLGGAGFPSFIKLDPGPQPAIETLLLNGAECEPYITCDDMLMRERADEIIAGLAIMSHALQARERIIAVEDNKPQALASLAAAIERAGRRDIELVKVPTRYPTGGAKQLVRIVTGKEVPTGKLSMDMGVVCYNVATAASIHRAIEYGEPLISRVVTVSGGAVAKPRNFDVRIGTPMSDLLQQAGGTRSESPHLLMGGPMMGFSLNTPDLPVIKTTNCLLAPNPGELGERNEVRPCIRCGACAEACPANLLPQQLYWHARAKDFDKVQDYHLFDCIECGCCAYVCPSNLPLVQYYRFAKTAIWGQERDKKKADQARQRYESRQARVEQEKAEREARLKKKSECETTSDDAKKAAIQAALERAKAKKAAGGEPTANDAKEQIGE